MRESPSRPRNPDAGQLLFIGIEGAALGPDTRRLLEEVRPGGVILFRRNVPGLPDLAALCAGIRSAVDPPPLLAIDEEGGRVTRLAPHVTGLPPAALASGAGAGRLAGYWQRYGDLLRALGLDIDFAPVLDLCPPDAPNGIADRSFGTDPERVTQCASAVIEGLSAAGVLPTLKHFPGLGPTLLDSHHRLPSATRDRGGFEREDLEPWRRLAPQAAAVMIAHAHYAFYSGPDPIAASLSRQVSTHLLRDVVGFRGAAISDDLEMKAVADRVPWEELAPRAVEAGSDMVLICHRPDRIRSARESLERRADADAAFAGRCTEALARVEGLRSRCASLRGERSGEPASPGEIDEARAALVSAAASIDAAVA